MPRNTHPTIHCSRCNKAFASPEKLRGHERRAHNPKPDTERGPARPGIDYPAPDPGQHNQHVERVPRPQREYRAERRNR